MNLKQIQELALNNSGKQNIEDNTEKPSEEIDNFPQQNNKIEDLIKKIKGSNDIGLGSSLFLLEQINDSLKGRNDLEANKIISKMIEYYDKNVNDINSDFYKVFSSYISKLKSITEKYRIEARKEHEKAQEDIEIELNSRIQEVINIKIKGSIEEEKTKKLIEYLQEKLKDSDLGEKEKQTLKDTISCLENIRKADKDLFLIIPDVNKKLNKSLNQIRNTNFPGIIDIFGKNVTFDRKEDAIKAIRLIKEGIEERVFFLSDMLETGLGKIIKIVGRDLTLEKLWELDKFIFDWGFFKQISESRIHWRGDERGLLGLDFLTSVTTLFLLSEMNVVIFTAIKSSGGKLFKDQFGSKLGMGLMEDYDLSRRINPMSLDNPKEADLQEFYQREALYQGLKATIEGLNENTVEQKEKKQKLLSDLDNLEKYKLVKTSTFFFKAFLIGKQIGLKNFYSIEYYWYRLQNSLEGARFWKLFMKEFQRKNGTKYKRPFPKLTGTEIGFSKSKYTPEVNKIIDKGYKKMKENLLEIFSSFDINKKDNKLEADYGKVREEKLNSYLSYIDTILGINESEAQRRKSNIKSFFKKLENNNYILSEKSIKEQVMDLQDGFLSKKEFIQWLKEDKITKEIIDNDYKLMDFLENYEKLGKLSLLKISFKSKNKRLYNFIKAFSNGNIKGTKSFLNKKLEKFLDGEITDFIKSRDVSEFDRREKQGNDKYNELQEEKRLEQEKLLEQEKQEQERQEQEKREYEKQQQKIIETKSFIDKKSKNIEELKNTIEILNKIIFEEGMSNDRIEEIKKSLLDNLKVQIKYPTDNILTNEKWFVFNNRIVSEEIGKLIQKLESEKKGLDIKKWELENGKSLRDYYTSEVINKVTDFTGNIEVNFQKIKKYINQNFDGETREVLINQLDIEIGQYLKAELLNAKLKRSFENLDLLKRIELSRKFQEELEKGGKEEAREKFERRLKEIKIYKR